MPEEAASSNVLGLTAQIVSAHVSNNAVSAEALPQLIQQVYKTLAGVGKEPARRGAGQEIGIPRPHRLSRGWQEAEDAEAPSQDSVRPDSGTVS